ncbi:hypothetical protein [Janthinobacterium sp. 61]|uniref:hypothetical protein n=1 Tax=Janthinobacterium sp. 61 TaxID=2035209 RepID=UPI000C7153E4|nr:hypothetical protein [Janthinobacterium sp. 61]
MASDEKIAHLGFIQGVINRMVGNSFLIKGWLVTLVAATFALSADKTDPNFTYLAVFPVIFFWWLDAYFLHQEKLYRKLYEKVADDIESSATFSMNAYKYKDEVKPLYSVFFSKTLSIFYGAITALTIIVMWKVVNLIKLC